MEPLRFFAMTLQMRHPAPERDNTMPRMSRVLVTTDLHCYHCDSNRTVQVITPTTRAYFCEACLVSFLVPRPTRPDLSPR